MDVVTLGMAKAATGTRIKIIERDKPVPVATRAQPPFDSSTGLSAVDVKGTAKLQHKMVRTAHGLQVAFTNWGGISTTEGDGPTDITVRGSIEYPATQMFPLTFSGRRSVVIEPGGTVLSDPLGVTLTKGTTFWSRTFAQPAAGGKIFRAGFITTSSGEGHNYDGAQTDLTAPGAASLTGLGGSQRAYGPAAILGRVIDPGKPVIAGIGDSIMTGTNDSDIGYVARALADNYSYQRVSFPGEAFFGWNTNYGVSRQRRAGLLERVGATHIVCEYGVNSLSLSLVDLQAATVATWLNLAVYRVPLYQTTLTPQTSSTDAYATTANQTLIYPAREPVRVGYNNWLRDGAPLLNGAAVAVGSNAAGTLRIGDATHPVNGVFEVADFAETARNSGIWRAGYTGDGTHPGAVGATALAGAINPAVFGPVSAT